MGVPCRLKNCRKLIPAILALWHNDFPAVFGFDERNVGILWFVAGCAFQRAFYCRLCFFFIGVGDFAEGDFRANGFHLRLFGLDTLGHGFFRVCRFGFVVLRDIDVLGGFGGIAVNKFGEEGFGDRFRALFGTLGEAADSGKGGEEQGFEEGFHGLFLSNF